MPVVHFRKGYMKIKPGYYYLDYYNNTGIPLTSEAQQLLCDDALIAW